MTNEKSLEDSHNYSGYAEDARQRWYRCMGNRQLGQRAMIHTLRETGLICLVSIAAVSVGYTHLAYGLGAYNHSCTTLNVADHPIAVESRTINISDKAALHLQSHQGTKILNEHGFASGSLSGTLDIKITLSYTQASITFFARPNGGTLSGKGVERYYVAGGNGHFQGTVTITHGTGRYTHVRAANIQLNGTIKRKRYEVVADIWGQLHV